jgi:hypothetical protein
VKYIVAHVPNPLKVKWKHFFLLMLRLSKRPVQWGLIPVPGEKSAGNGMKS